MPSVLVTGAGRGVGKAVAAAKASAVVEEALTARSPRARYVVGGVTGGLTGALGGLTNKPSG
jgi:hypothetical protein